MFPSVTHMIAPERTKEQLEQLQTEMVETWKAARTQRFNEGRGMRPDIYRPQPESALHAKALHLIRHCLDKPVSTD